MGWHARQGNWSPNGVHEGGEGGRNTSTGTNKGAGGDSMPTINRQKRTCYFVRGTRTRLSTTPGKQ